MTTEQLDYLEKTVMEQSLACKPSNHAGLYFTSEQLLDLITSARQLERVRALTITDHPQEPHPYIELPYRNYQYCKTLGDALDALDKEKDVV